MQPFNSPPLSPRSSCSINEHLTRRSVEKAAANRLAVLQRKLQSSLQSQKPPWMMSPIRRASQSPEPGGPHHTGPKQAGRRAMTPDPTATRGHSPGKMRWGQMGGFLPGRTAPSVVRARSTSPSLWQGGYEQQSPHHLYNDFIQLPLAGTYRHMDQVYGSGV